MSEVRRLRRDARDNTDRLRAAAIETFGRQGLGAPLGEVARRAGVSEGTLYHRFGGRAQLIDAVLRDLMGSRLDAAIERASGASSPWEALEGYVRELCALQTEDRAFTDAVSRAFPDAHEVEALCMHTVDAADELMAAAREAGVVRPDARGSDIRTLLVAHGAALDSAAADASRLVELFLAGLRATA